MAEVRVQAEGALWFVQASGSGRTWATASAPASGLFAYVQSFSFTSAAGLETIKERGTPDHHKIVNRDPIKVSLEVLWTGLTPIPASGSGASVPMYHFEYRASAAETPTTGRYFQFHGCPVHSMDWTEDEKGDKMKFELMALGMNGPTASGFLS